MVVKQIGLGVANVFGGGLGQRAVGDFDTGNDAAHGAFLVGNAVAALMEQVCSGLQNRTIDPWLRSRPMSMQIAPTSLVAPGLAKFGTGEYAFVARVLAPAGLRSGSKTCNSITPGKQ
jgi:hypothetical protein